MFQKKALMLVCFFVQILYISPLYLLPNQVNCLPIQNRNRNHDDFPKGLQWIPRKVTAFCETHTPQMILGNQTLTWVGKDGLVGPRPIPEIHKFQISLIRFDSTPWPVFLPYFAIHLSNRIHIRAGCRWDDLDSHYIWPSFTIKHIDPDWQVQLWYWENRQT